MSELACQFLASPSKIWKLGKFEYQKLALRLTFADRLAYCPENGFRTAKTTLPFKVLEGLGRGESEMARPTRFERVTFAFGARIVYFAETIRFQPNARYSTEIQKEV
ncbi:hypothetical protein [Bosea sp. (in: a-proteobacteria)]|uniref:hypothetical protein n=1 Tax=Bosea sp. (in: a-proteobacteria) TaxID=1871050 RepID=UPI003F6FD5AD